MTIKNIRLLLIILLNLTICLLSFGQNKSDSLLNIIKSGKYDSNMVLAFAGLCDEFHYNDPQKAILYGQKGLIVSEKIGYIKGFAICNNNIGSVYYNQGNYKTAWGYYQKSLKIYDYLSLKKEVSDCYQNIGKICNKEGKCLQAIEYYQKSMEIIEKCGDKKRLANCYLNIGNLHKDQRNSIQALKYYKKSLNIYEKLNCKKGMADCYNNIGNIYTYQGNISLALEYFNKSLEFYILAENKIGESANYNNIGTIYAKQGNYAEALEYFKKSLNIKVGLNDEIGIAGCCTNISYLDLILKNYPQALEYGYKALAIAKKIEAFDMKQQAYFNLSEIYDNLGNIKEAFKYYKLYSVTKDSILNKESQKKVAEMEIKYETEKKEKEIDRQNTKITLLEQGKKIEKYKRNGLIAGVLVISLVSIIILFNLRKRIKLNNQLFENQKKQFFTQKLLSEAELNNEKLKSIQLNNELEYKNKELMTFALFITQKNEILKNIKKHINTICKKTTNNDNIQLINQLSSEVSYYLSLEKDKKEFQAHVNNIYQSFFMKLNEKFPDLTETERRISSLLRINLSSKDISVLMNISAKGVEMNRYRLRKKLNLPPEENLSEFLNKIG
ncbi:MAG: tetratricopeptide repeat protein [Bacteroidetes bacterium]|nr:tetratricopeptide repeat protein [Bacteroidota bacterium]